MDIAIAFLSLALFFAFIIGLIRPSLVRMQNRKRSTVIYLGGFLLLSVAGSIVYPTEKNRIISESNTNTLYEKSNEKEFKYNEKTLKEYRTEPKQTRYNIINNYVELKKLPASAASDFYACMSEYTFTKDGELKLGDVLGWCFGDYEKDQSSLSNKINLDAFKDNFSGWDGSYRPLEKRIKESMNNEPSYKHISTTYHLQLNKDPHAIVKTTFSGTNAFGGIVKQTIAARVNVRTGEIESFIDN